VDVRRAGRRGDWRATTQAFDRPCCWLCVSRHPGSAGPPAVQDAARDITALGGVAVLAMMIGIVAGFLILDGKRNMALFVCGSVVGGFDRGHHSKDIFSARPDLVRASRTSPERVSPARIP